MGADASVMTPLRTVTLEERVVVTLSCGEMLRSVVGSSDTTVEPERSVDRNLRVSTLDSTRAL